MGLQRIWGRQSHPQGTHAVSFHPQGLMDSIEGTCKECLIGENSTGGTNKCEICEEGYFQNQAKQIECIECNCKDEDNGENICSRTTGKCSNVNFSPPTFNVIIGNDNTI